MLSEKANSKCSVRDQLLCTRHQRIQLRMPTNHIHQVRYPRQSSYPYQYKNVPWQTKCTTSGRRMYDQWQTLCTTMVDIMYGHGRPHVRSWQTSCTTMADPCATIPLNVYEMLGELIITLYVLVKVGGSVYVSYQLMVHCTTFNFDILGYKSNIATTS